MAGRTGAPTRVARVIAAHSYWKGPCHDCRARILDPAAIERKLALNTYNVDASRAHIRIIDHDVCLHCVRQQCINCCPANCYVPADDGRVIFSYEGCVECGTCRIVCHEFRNIEWTYPRGGFGIQYRYG